MKNTPSDVVSPAAADVATPPPSPLSEKLRRFGAGAMGLSIAVHAIFVCLAIFCFVKWIQPKPDDAPDFGGGERGGGGGSRAATRQAATAKRMASSLSSNRRIASENSLSDLILPAPDDAAPDSMPMEYSPGSTAGGPGNEGGNGNGPGHGGWGNGGNGAGGNGGGGPGIFRTGLPPKLFFGQEMPDRRTAFVLDYSRSMEEGGRKKLLQQELEKSLAAMHDEMPYQVILFAGYAWLPGDKVNLAADQMSATITGDGHTYEWLRPSRDNFDWIAVKDGNKHFVRGVAWTAASPGAIEQTMSGVRAQTLQMNTCWELPLEMALAMQPAPEVIYFMTDGITGDKDASRIVDRLVRKATATRTHINAISMMEPVEVKAMRDLAQKTGGGFSIVNLDRSSKVIFPERLPE